MYIATKMSFASQSCEDITTWIIAGMTIMLIFGALLYGVIWFVMDRYHENCYLCGKQMDVMRNRESELLATMDEYEEQIDDCIEQNDNMHKREEVISNQVNLITTFRQGIYEVQRSMDQYIATIEKYRELKAADNSWFYSLTIEQKNYMYRLRNYLDLGENVNLKAATVIVRRYSEQTQRILTVQLIELENALSKMNISEMEQLQVDMNEMHLSNLLETHMTRAKSNILSMSRELQVRGAFNQIFSLLYDFLEAAINSPLVLEIIKKVMLS